MRRYESYKDSGVDWLGEVPSHWELKRLKQLFVEKKHKQSLSLNCGAISFGKVIEKSDDKVTEATKRSYQEVLKGEFLINPLNLNYDLISLRIALSEIDVVVSAGYIVLKEKQIINKKYFSYLLHRYDVAYMKLLGSGVRQTINYGHISDSILVIPPLSEQQKIAQFLDDKTAKIDQAVDLAEKQIALLKEHKQILIQNAVTRGLNPDVPLKDSGVEWIGQVPEHWEVVSMKRVVKEHSGNGFPIDLQGNNGNIPFLKVSDFSENQDKYIFKWNNSVTNKVIKQKKWNIVPKNSIVTAKIGEALRKNHRKILSIDSIIDNNCLGIEIKKADVLFGYYLHCALDFDLFTNPGAIPSLAMDKYRNQKIVLPPFQEQQEIADYLEQQTAKIDQAIALKTAHIEKLKEYKSVLINDVVTGKLQV
ncbi:MULTISPECIES: restriction endonuclease subunit S [Haemophilus]|uniref:Type I site-specific restriction-modification system, S subunit n=1 Tax=Haemophilus aegyptius TaxID=197575 RepID=A0ABY1VWG8_HAEAE|nr:MULTISPECIES: restriction endonuclease subunit S [Haemophilus]OBX81482.1 restriction endonuclease subunit S [Haemophilus aegyptius]QEQ60556.1 restriction endonuclease subunit S [Haemophilus influenzae biotype aegyptius]TMQ44379.1 restriction endonuclease subunit S [Haemophilus influenzae biotype aegyptius]UAK82391.1 restriction endonuclease subunit S [Haemophilus aegyptius]SQH38315.1 type I site-specific restriction-modification system, S subunit [Haemophilus aegyptius]